MIISLWRELTKGETLSHTHTHISAQSSWIQFFTMSFLDICLLTSSATESTWIQRGCHMKLFIEHKVEGHTVKLHQYSTSITKYANSFKTYNLHHFGLQQIGIQPNLWNGAFYTKLMLTYPRQCQTWAMEPIENIIYKMTGITHDSHRKI